MKIVTAFDLGVLIAQSQSMFKEAQQPTGVTFPGRLANSLSAPSQNQMPPKTTNTYPGKGIVPAHPTNFDMTNPANLYHYDKAVQRNAKTVNPQAFASQSQNIYPGKENVPAHPTNFDMTNPANRYHYEQALRRNKQY